MGADGELKRQTKTDPTEAFLWAGHNAIARYANWRFAALTREIQDTLERERPSGVFDHPSHTNQWREFCYHAHFGPPELEAVFDHLVDPLIVFHLEQLPPEEAMLLSIAQRWAREDIEHHNGATVSPNLIKQGIWVALHGIALAADCDASDG